MYRIEGISLAVGALALIMSASEAKASVVGTVNVTSGTALTTVTLTTLTFSPPCDTTASAASIAVLGGCAQGEVSAYNPGVLGTPSGPLNSTINGQPPVGSGIFIAPLSVSTVFPLTPFLKFMNSAQTAVGITVELDSVGAGAQTNCSTLVVNGGGCSLFAGSPLVLFLNQSGGTSATLPITGLAWDGAGAKPLTGLSNFSGSFTTQISQITGITGTGANGNVTPDDIQKYFGCPDTASNTQLASCTGVNKSITSSNSGTFTAVIAAVPEPGTVSTFIGAGLCLLSLYRRKSRKS
jgi:hypothetical protein